MLRIAEDCWTDQTDRAHDDAACALLYTSRRRNPTRVSAYIVHGGIGDEPFQSQEEQRTRDPIAFSIRLPFGHLLSSHTAVTRHCSPDRTPGKCALRVFDTDAPAAATSYRVTLWFAHTAIRGEKATADQH